MLGHAYEMLLAGTMIVLGILIIVSMIRSVLGPGISDRVIAVNMIGTIIIMLIAILSLFLDESYLVDVCLIYAMVSFLGVVVLCKVYTGVYLQRKNMKANLGAVEDNLRRQEESGNAEAGSGETAEAGTGEAAETGTGETAEGGSGEAAEAETGETAEAAGLPPRTAALKTEAEEQPKEVQ